MGELIEDLTAEEAANAIIEQFEREYVNDLSEMEAMATLIPDVRKLKDPKLKVAYCADWIFEHREEMSLNWRAVKSKVYKYRKILDLPNEVKVQMLDPWERVELLMNSPEFRELTSKADFTKQASSEVIE